MNHRFGGTLIDEDQIPVVLAGVAMVFAVAALLLAVFDWHVPGRSLIAVVSLLSVPGIPLTMALPIREVHGQFVLGIALSLAAVLLVSLVQVESGLWSPLATQLILFVIGLASTVFAIRAVAVR